MSCFLDLVGICPSLSHKILIQTPLQYSALLPAELMPLQWQSVHWNLCGCNSFLLRYEYFGDTATCYLELWVERKTDSESCVPKAGISTTCSFPNMIHEMSIRNTSIFQAAEETPGQRVGWPIFRAECHWRWVGISLWIYVSIYLNNAFSGIAGF